MDITDSFVEAFWKSLLAKDMTEADVREFLFSGHVRLREYVKGDIIFHEGDHPQFLYMLIYGKVSIQKESFSGRHICISEISEPGDLFGEVYLLMEKPYDMYVEAVQDTQVIAIRRDSFSVHGITGASSSCLAQRNLMLILAQKAYFMHSRLKVLASGSLRERILRFLFWNMDGNGRIRLNFSREAWANYLAAARPSLSRELSTLQKEGILNVNGKEICVLDRTKFEAYL